MSAVFINLLLFWQSQNFVINFPIAMKLLKTAMIQRAWRNQIYGLIRETCNNVQLFLSVFAREVIVSEWRQCGYYYLTDSLWFCWHSHAHGQACDLLVIFGRKFEVNCVTSFPFCAVYWWHHYHWLFLTKGQLAVYRLDGLHRILVWSVLSQLTDKVICKP